MNDSNNKMYYLVSKNGLSIPMNINWYEAFEKIKWNENESIQFNDESGKTEITTLPGKIQGHRLWVYRRYSGNIVDKGIIIES